MHMIFLGNKNSAITLFFLLDKAFNISKLPKKGTINSLEMLVELGINFFVKKY